MNTKNKGFLLSTMTALLGVLFLCYIFSSEERLFDSISAITKERITRRKQSISFNSVHNAKSNITWIILWYNFPFYLKTFLKNFKTKKCRNLASYCILSTNNSDLHRSSVVIFTHSTLPKLPPLKKTSQIWMFNTMENKRFTSWPSSAWKNKFEWIMSYRRDADILRPYGKIVKLDRRIDRNYSLVFRQKKKVGVWMASHCHTPSLREKYIQQLQEYLELDTFGRCGKKMCGVHDPNMNECLRNFSRDYKFYFSFENSICTDFSTEKVFNLYAYTLIIIPVINGPPQAIEYLPKGTYINTLDYSSPKLLAERLKEIGSSEHLYTQYLKEKDKYSSLEQIEIFREAMCTVCKNLDQLEGRKISTKQNLRSAYGKHC